MVLQLHGSQGASMYIEIRGEGTLASGMGRCSLRRMKRRISCDRAGANAPELVADVKGEGNYGNIWRHER